jgi:hypothetical protein
VISDQEDRVPYIPPSQRTALDPHLEAIVEEIRRREMEKQDGAVNYVFSRILHAVYDMTEGSSYYKFNRALGVLEAVKQELYRTKVGPYEDDAAERNGVL